MEGEEGDAWEDRGGSREDKRYSSDQATGLTSLDVDSTGFTQTSRNTERTHTAGTQRTLLSHQRTERPQP
jgi:hypothetical protein